MKKVSIAVIGCGRIGQMHAKNVQLHEKTNLACIYDPNDEFAKKISIDLGIQAVKNVDEILADFQQIFHRIYRLTNNFRIQECGCYYIY